MNINKIYKAKEFINRNYNQEISADKLCDISCYSFRNLQRIFVSLFNETTNSYKKRLKLENAYKKLIYTKESISDIALEVGYSDLQALRKAFKKEFKISPSRARKERSCLILKNLEVVNIEKIEPEFVFLNEIEVFYKSINTPYNNMQINECWENLLSDFEELNNAEYYGLIADDILITDEIYCKYDACISKKNLQINFPRKIIEKGNYAKFIHKGSYNKIENTYNQIFGYWVLNTEKQLLEKPIIEKYLKHYENTLDENDFETEILIPIS